MGIEIRGGRRGLGVVGLWKWRLWSFDDHFGAQEAREQFDKDGQVQSVAARALGVHSPEIPVAARVRSRGHFFSECTDFQPSALISTSGSQA